MSPRKGVDLAIGVAFLALLAVGLGSFASLQRLRDDDRWVVEAERVLSELKTVQSDVQDAETGQRGFLLTGRDDFLAPYDAALRALNRDLASLQESLRDPEQRRRGLELRALVAAKIRDLERTVALASQGRREESVAMVRSGHGNRLMARVRAQVDEMEAAENALLDARRLRADRSARRAAWMIALGTALALLLLWLARRRIVADLAGRAAAERELRRSEESVRALYRVASSQDLSFDEKIRALLDRGRERFGLSIGVLSRIEGDLYEIVEARTDDDSIPRGAVFPLSDTYCANVLEEGEALAVEHAAESEWRARDCYAVFGLEAYLGVPVRVGGAVYGTLAYSDRQKAPQPFTTSDMDFIRLLAQWIGGEIERRQAELAVVEREARYRVLVENASDIIYTTDARGYFTYANAVALDTMGYRMEELVGRRYLELVREDLRADVHRHYHEQFQSCVPNSYLEFAAVASDGREVWVGQNLTLLLDDGDVVGAQAVARDITRQREVERMKDEFLSVVSHELRTPLTAIRGSLGLLASGKLGDLEEKGQRMLEIAAQNTDRLVRLINDLLDFEKIESGKAPMEVRPVETLELVRQAVDTMQTMADRAGVTLRTEVAPGTVLADPDRVQQVLTNLLSNAVKFSDAGAVVEVRAEIRAGMMSFAVRDHGRGIPSDKLELVFQRFQQVDSSDARQKGGTGLGLPIARSIVQQHGGEMSVQSRWGEGSTFHFTLPLAPAAPAPRNKQRERCDVLIVEDDDGLAGVMSETFERRGISTCRVRSAEDALALGGRMGYGLLVLDLSLPGVDGFDLVDRLREDPELRARPLLVYTARDLTDADRDRLRMGPTEFIVKSRSSMEHFEQCALTLLGMEVTP